MRNYILVFLLWMVIGLSSYGADTWKEAVALMAKPCAEFVQTQSKPEVIEKWRKKLDSRIEQRIVDQSGDYEQHLQSIFLDWAAGNEGLLRGGDKEAFVELCMFIGVFVEKGMNPPPMVRERLTVEVANSLVERLKSF